MYLAYLELHNECVYMYNKMLVPIKNQLIIKTQSMFTLNYITNCSVFSFFDIRNQTDIHTRHGH